MQTKYTHIGVLFATIHTDGVPVPILILIPTYLYTWKRKYAFFSPLFYQPTIWCRRVENDVSVCNAPLNLSPRSELEVHRP